MLETLVAQLVEYWASGSMEGGLNIASVPPFCALLLT